MEKLVSPVLYRNNRQKASVRFCLGSSDHHTGFEGKTTGAILAMKLLSEEHNFKTVLIFIDSCMFMAASILCKPTPSHYLTDVFHKNITSIKGNRSTVTIHIKWVPAHKWVQGNKKADELTKKAITHGSSNRSKLPKELTNTLSHSKAALKQGHRMKLNEEAQAEWLTSSHYHRMKFTDLISPSSSYTKLTATLPRKHASWILQLRTGHFPVTKYLFHIGRAHSPTCPDCLQEVDSIHHLILQCPVHQLARAELHHALGDRDIKLNCMLTKPKPMKALIKILAHTGRWMHDLQHPQNEQHDQQN